MKTILYGISLILFGMCCIGFSFQEGYTLAAIGMLFSVCGIIIATLGFFSKALRTTFGKR